MEVTPVEYKKVNNNTVQFNLQVKNIGLSNTSNVVSFATGKNSLV
jgi:hypothetical protein